MSLDSIVFRINNYRLLKRGGNHMWNSLCGKLRIDITYRKVWSLFMDRVMVQQSSSVNIILLNDSFRRIFTDPSFYAMIWETSWSWKVKRLLFFTFFSLLSISRGILLFSCCTIRCKKYKCCILKYALLALTIHLIIAFIGRTQGYIYLYFYWRVKEEEK